MSRISLFEGREKILIGFGEEWSCMEEDKEREKKLLELYASFADMLSKTDYFIVTTASDGLLLKSPFDASRTVAPCGNIHWRQCEKACTKDVWEEGEIADGICPHCGAPLVPNTVAAENYIEESYLPQWKAYTGWLTTTINRELLVLELGVGFKLPSIIRWPFEKTVYFNQKSELIRVHSVFFQIPENIAKRAEGISENSVEWFEKLEDKI